MNDLQQFAYSYPLRSADAPMLDGYFQEQWPVRYGLTVNY